MNRIISFARDPILFSAKALLALDLVLWLCWLPVMVRVHTVPTLLNRLARSEKSRKKDADGVKGCCRDCNSDMQFETFPFTVLPKSLPPPIAHAISDIEPNGISG